MTENTKIEWATHTFNPWVGCTKVSPACDHCYAENWAKRTGHPELWSGKLRRTSDSNWRKVLKWNREAEGLSERPRVFCASLSDVFDNQADPAWRDDLFALIEGTPNLDWLLLTKRPQNIAKMLPDDWGDGWKNVWLGTTVENQAEADRRIPHLLNVPAKVRFLSCEPLLAPVNLERVAHENVIDGSQSETEKISWVICGGESGPGARPMHPTWARSLRDQCVAAGVAYHFKQWGEWGHEMNPPVKDAHRWPIYASEPYGGVWSYRVGKKAAGRLLDGRTWDELPVVTL